MRSFLRAASVALVLVAASSGRAAAQSAPQKLAYIRSSVLLDQAPGRAEAEAQFNKETAGYGDQMKRMQDSLNTMIGAYQKSQASLSATARDTRAREIENKRAEYERRTREMEQKAQQRQGELVQPILDRVKQAIEDARVEGGYAMVFNVDQQGSPLVAMDKSLDITDKVLARLKSMTATTPARPNAPSPAPAGVVRPQTP